MAPTCRPRLAGVFVLSLVLVLAAVMPAAAQDPPPVPAPQPEQAPAAAPTTPTGPGGPPATPAIRPYDRVITKDAKSDEGLFTVHRIGERVYYEIPAAELGKEFLWVSQIARTTVGAGQGGQAVGSRVVKWERRNNRVLLRGVSYDIVADRNQPIARAVEAANNDTILMAFNIEALGKSEAPVIDVTRVFTTEVPEFSGRARVRSRTFDPSRSFIERAVSFPDNIEVEATHTYSTGVELQGPVTTPQALLNAARPGSATVVMHYSMVKLPEKPMMPRVFDARVGYFSVQQVDYGRDEHRAERRRYISRWRLEKKDPSAAVSEPVKPIAFYIDPATPSKWVPFIKRGIESWRPAFEEAGFTNAIIAKDAPSKEQDPDWSAEDARYSVIRWLPSTTENAFGPHIADPRTGEILEADIQFHHNVMNLARDWYFVQVGPLDPRAAKLPLPDDLMGKLIEYVAAHEVGHSLGFQHNMKASSTYPAEKVRDREWVKKMGHTPTLMDYSRFNYVAQPEDRIDPADLIPGIGPYDRWATMWGYKPIPAATPDEEKKTLDEWARAQDATPWLRFSTADSLGSDPGELTEAVGDADAVRSTTMGLKNLERVAAMLLTATTRPGEPYDDLEEVYGRLLGQWVLEMNHVAALVGGVQSRQKVSTQDGPRFEPLPRARQREAMQFLSANAFRTPSFVIKPEILRRIEPVGVLDRIRTSQLRVLATLLAESRIGRLVEQEAVEGANAYRPTDFYTDLRRAIWSEVDMAGVQVDPYRRNLQRAYLDAMGDKVNRTGSESRSLARGELRSLDTAVRTAIPKAADRITRLHLQDVRDQIGRILDPKFAPAATPQPNPLIVAGADEPVGCWFDYAIHRSFGSFEPFESFSR
jgi:hypothetical protein